MSSRPSSASRKAVARMPGDPGVVQPELGPTGEVPFFTVSFLGGEVFLLK